MRTTVSQRGQTVIPAKLRRRYGIAEGSEIEWVDTGAGLKIVPIPPDPVASLRGIGKGERLVERLLEERRDALAQTSQLSDNFLGPTVDVVFHD